MLLDFFNSLEGKVKGLKGFAILYTVTDEQGSLVLTFWENRQDMDTFYQPGNKALADFVEKTTPMMEQPPERTDYAVAKLKT